MYKIKSDLIKVPEYLRQPMLETLKLYDTGEDLTDSPLIRSKVNRFHYEAWKDLKAGMSEEEALEKSQKRLIELYDNIKANGFNGSKICCYFEDDGNIKLYDGCHRLSILEHLGIVQDVNVETVWNGIDGRVGKDFPLVDVLMKEAPGGKWTYQPVNDPRLDGWKVDRYDAQERLNYILSKIKGKKVLDIGCSEGYYSRELARRGYEVTGIDRSKGLIAAARYLTILEGLKVDYHVVNDWSEFITNRYETILFLAVIHNDMKTIGIEKGLEKLKLLRDKAEVIFIEVPNNHNERGWGREGYPQYDFHAPESIKAIKTNLDMKLTDTFKGRRTIYTMESQPWWSLEKYIPDWRNQYWPLFDTLKTTPCRNIMEVGTHNGKNAVAMIKAAALKVPENEIHYYGFDLFEGRTESLTAEEYSPVEIPTVGNVKDFIQSYTTAQVTLTKGNTRETLKAEFPEMDLIYIDGGHSVETTRSDWQNSQRFMRDHTIVYFDDYNDEMTFMGSYFITKELGNFNAEVLPQTNYYKRPYGRLKCQLLRVTKPKKRHIRKTDHFRFHLLGLPHSKTVKDWGPCAFTQLVYRFSQMMKDMGHEVYHYGTEGSDVDCTEHIDVLKQSVQKEAYGDWDPYKQLWIHNGNDLAYTTFRKNAIEEVNRRKEPGDILLITNGHWLKEVGDKAGQGMAVVEPFVGYLGCYTRRRVFPSYAWMHHIYGLESRKNTKENFATGNWYDAVIPHYFDPADHTFETKKEDYFFYSGRLIQRKGIHIAVDICKRIGAKLIVAGQPLWPDKLEESLKHVGCLQPHVEYKGVLTMPELDEIKKKARAVFVPSLYMEPFGLVVPEALLSGTPVITTDWGAFPEIVPQGKVGYRCRTADDFIWACNNVDKIDPQECRDYAINNFSMERVGECYQEYFTKVHDLFGKGWYTEREREGLNWLNRY